MASPRIIGYVRVSTEEQEESGLGLEAQRRRIDTACDFKGYQLIDTVDEGGISGTTVAGRPGLRRALRAIAKGDADGLIVATMSRLSRSAADTALLFDWFQEAGATLIVLDLDVDTSTAVGQAFARIMGVINQLERDLTAERTRAALGVKRRRGERVGRPGVHEIPTLARRIKHWREHGTTAEPGAWTWQRIADQLNLEQVPTLRGGKLWRVSSVQTAGGYVRPESRKAKTSLPPIKKPRR
jgi:DNA invertase Pin-like site-specific DNA recombinase